VADVRTAFALCRWLDEEGGHWELCGPDSEWRRLGDALAVWESEGWALVKQVAATSFCWAEEIPGPSMYMFERRPDPAAPPASNPLQQR
jgi:hypothetical protein